MRNEASEKWRREQEERLAFIRAEIKRHSDALIPLRRERDRISRDLGENKTFERRSGMQDMLRLDAEQVAIHIKYWLKLDEHNTMASLAREANISRRLIYKILNEDDIKITLTSADRILTAMGMTHVIGDLSVVRHTRKAPIPKPPESQYYEE